MATDSTNAMFGMTTSGIPVSHLDYSYIGKCTNQKELEKIINVLRSGEEGTYPELLTFAEKQLESINPKSKILRRDIPIQSYRDLEGDERDQLKDEFKDWFSEIRQKDSQLKQDSTIPNTDHLHPVRSSKTVASTTKDSVQASSDKSKRSTAPRGYQEWDRFDPDKELQTLEQKEEQELKAKQARAKVNIKESGMAVTVDTTGKTEAEKSLLAEREKDKGNEAFRCGDYQESLVYYSRSLQYKQTAAAYNNRAYANLKLEKHQEAIADCNIVIKLEPNNLKAYIRRALAYQGIGEHDNARRDLNTLLEIEPNNKRAKELLKELSTTNQRAHYENTSQANGDNTPKKKGKRMKIIEVENDDETTSQNEEKSTKKSTQNVNPSTDSSDGSCLSSTKQNKQNTNSKKATNENFTEQFSNEDNVGLQSLKSGDVNEKLKLNEKSNDSLQSAKEKSQETEQSRNKSAESLPQSSQEAESSCDKESRTIVHKNDKEIVKATPPPVVELPGIVVKVKDEGTSLFKLGRYAEASEKFTQAIEILDKDKSQFQSALSSLLNNRAACLQKIGDAFGCIKDCTASLFLVPGSVKPLLKRASSNEMLERYEESYVDFNAVMLVDPSNQTALNGKTRVSKHLLNTYGKSWRERIENVKVSQTPVSNELLNTGSSASSAAEKTFNILGDKTTGNPTTPSNPTLSKPTIPDRPTSAKETTGSSKPTVNSNEARKNLSEQSKQGSASTSSQQESPEKTFEQYKERGNSFVKQGKLDQAIQCYTECVGLDPSKVAVYTNRALCYLRQDKFALAEEDTTKALELEAKNVKALYRRGLARKGLEKYEEAAKDLVNLIKIEPMNPSGKKELDIVLNLCRERRKKQQAAANQKTKEIPKQTNENKVENKKPTQRRRVQIEEVNSVEELSSKPSTQPSSASKPLDSSQSKEKVTSKTKDIQADKPSQVDKKPKASNAKDQKKKKIKLQKATPFDFFQAWNSVKQKDLSSYADILRQLNPALLPKVLSNKLDADMFRCFLGAITSHMIPNGEDKLSFEILQYLSTAQRFDMVKMFLDTNDCKALSEVFSKLATARTKTGYVNEDIFNGVINKYNI